MTRVLFWNVQRFGINKVFNASGKRPRKGSGGQTFAQAATVRRNLVMKVFAATQPDIIVLVEVSSGVRPVGDLATETGGVTGSVFLQAQLNAAAAPLNVGGWNQVPQLSLGMGETVSVFYRRQNATGTTHRYFTGPNRFTGGPAGTTVLPLGAAAGAYPGPAPGAVNFNAMLVPGGGGAPMVPATAQHNAGVAENTVSARIAFVNMIGGAPVAFGTRFPYMVTFTEANAAGVLQRNLSIFGVHPTPAIGHAYMATLATVQDIAGGLGPMETRIVGGDFNLNLLLAPGGAPSGAYAPLTGLGYTPLLNSVVPAPANLAQYRGYFSTHIRTATRTAASELLWSNPPNASQYPGYGYVGSNFTANFFAIDNILVWPLQPPPHNYMTTVMNPVVGTPFNAVLGPANAPPPGTVAMAHDLLNAPGVWPEAPAAAAWTLPSSGVRKGYDNYGHILQTSDHFAVFAVV